MSKVSKRQINQRIGPTEKVVTLVPIHDTTFDFTSVPFVVELQDSYAITEIILDILLENENWTSTGSWIHMGDGKYMNMRNKDTAVVAELWVSNTWLSEEFMDDRRWWLTK